MGGGAYSTSPLIENNRIKIYFIYYIFSLSKDNKNEDTAGNDTEKENFLFQVHDSRVEQVN